MICRGGWIIWRRILMRRRWGRKSPAEDWDARGIGLGKAWRSHGRPGRDRHVPMRSCSGPLRRYGVRLTDADTIGWDREDWVRRGGDDINVHLKEGERLWMRMGRTKQRRRQMKRRRSHVHSLRALLPNIISHLIDTPMPMPHTFFPTVHSDPRLSPQTSSRYSPSPSNRPSSPR